MDRRAIADRTTDVTEPTPTGEPTAETTWTCPLCGARAPDASDIYVHLQVRHRKSTIARAVLDATTDESLTGENSLDDAPGSVRPSEQLASRR